MSQLLADILDEGSSDSGEEADGSDDDEEDDDENEEEAEGEAETSFFERVEVEKPLFK